MDFLKKYNIDLEYSKYLETALTHTSYSNEHGTEHYERLEFLGDAVLELVSSEYIFKNYNLTEGEMTKMRASYVCEHALYEYSLNIGFIPYIKVGHGQSDDINETIIADVFEAIIGAIYLECGFDICKEYILSIISPYIKAGKVFYSDYKSLLQEMVQTEKKSVEYVVVNEDGPAHDKVYTINVVIDGIVFGTGTGKSKKDAQQKAARDAYNKCAS